MYSINGIPLDNDVMGWVFRAPSKPLSELTRERLSAGMRGRDGVVGGLPATVNPVTLPLVVQTPKAQLEALVALFGDGGVLTLTGHADREVRFETLSHSLTGYGSAEALVDAQFLIRLPGVFWRAKTPVTFTGAGQVACWPAGPVGQVGQVRNLFTNPSFETGSGTVEVRRNLILAPDTSSVANWVTTSGTITSEGGRLRFDAGSNNPSRLGAQAPLAAEKPAGTYRASFKAERMDASLVGVRVYLYHTTSGYLAQASLPTVAGNTRYEFTLTATAPFNRVYMEFYGSGISSGAVGYLSEPMLEAGAVAGAFFRPGSPSPDPDLTPSWTGTPNASESVLTGVGVANMAVANCLVIRSTRWKKAGEFSLRIIPTGATTNSYVIMPVGADTPERGTIVLTRHQEAPLTGPLHSYVGRGYWYPAPSVFTNTAPNVAGDTELRVYGEPVSVGSSFVLFHGGMAGSGDIWLDGYMRVKGEYTGPYFDGATPSTDRLVRFAWDGTANASTSTRTTYARWDGGLSAPVQDAVIRVKGPAAGVQVTDSSGAWVRLPDAAAGQWVRFEADSGRAYRTTTDTWSGGTDVSGLVDFDGPRGVFEITPVMRSGPDDRAGLLTVSGGAVVEVRGRSAHAL